MSKTSDLLFLCIFLVTAGCGGKTTNDDAFDGGTSAESYAGYGNSGSEAAGSAGFAGLSGTSGRIGANESLNEANDGGWSGIPTDSGRPVFNSEGGRPNFDVDGGRPNFDFDGGQRPNRGQTIPIEETPDAVQTTIEAELGDATIEDIEQQDRDGSVTYEVNAEVEGREVEITVGEDGTVLRKEEDVDPTSLPEAVTTTFTETVRETEIRRATKVTESEQVTYEIRATSAEGERIRINIAEDGTLLENGERNPPSA